MDSGLWPVITLSFWVSGVALFLSALIGIPIGTGLGLRSFRGRRLIITLIYTGMGLPPVVAGLFVYMMLSRAGPLGILGWLFTPQAMIVAQTVLGLPLVIGLTMAAVESTDPALRQQLRSLGATETQIARSILWEARSGVLIALIASFGGIISEVGAVMLVGGNIEGKTRVLTTSIVLQTRQGEFARAIAFGLVLLGTVFILNLAALQLRRRISSL